MRDETGLFIGFHLCRFWGGVESRREKECCGGRIITVAFVRCAKKGVVEAERECSTSTCDDKERSNGV
jgi:hypothetical protein